MKKVDKHQDSDNKVITSYGISFSGPLPTPSVLGGYEAVEKGSANRIITMAEEQVIHDNKMESRLIECETRNETLGMIFGFLTTLFLVSLGSFLIYYDKNIEGFVLALTPVGAIVGMFFYKARRQNIIEKQRNKST